MSIYRNRSAFSTFVVYERRREFHEVDMTSTNETRIVIIRQGNPGALAGGLGCIFAVLGIFTLGLLFVPIAAMCSLIAVARSCSRPNVVGIGISLLACALTVAGFMTSPSLWLLVAASSTGR